MASLSSKDQLNSGQPESFSEVFDVEDKSLLTLPFIPSDDEVVLEIGIEEITSSSSPIISITSEERSNIENINNDLEAPIIDDRNMQNLIKPFAKGSQSSDLKSCVSMDTSSSSFSSSMDSHIHSYNNLTKRTVPDITSHQIPSYQSINDFEDIEEHSTTLPSKSASIFGRIFPNTINTSIRNENNVNYEHQHSTEMTPMLSSSSQSHSHNLPPIENEMSTVEVYDNSSSSSRPLMSYSKPTSNHLLRPSSSPTICIKYSFILKTIALVCVVMVINYITYLTLKHQMDNNSNRIFSLTDRIESIKNDLTDLRTKSAMKFESLKNDLIALDTREDSLDSFTHTQFSTLSDNFSALNEQQTAVHSEVSVIGNQINEHDKLLAKLSNRTSNAEVLDKLKETKLTVFSELDHTKLLVADALDKSNRNVSKGLQQTHTELNSTVSYMKNVIAAATVEIFSIQSEVNGHLSDIEKNLKTTVADLNLAVDSAKETISTQVLGVKEEIQQYVAVTNKQFAAENDFVIHQLSGIFMLLGCLITFWQITSHLKHYSKPDVQDRLIVVLGMVPVYSLTSWLALVFPSYEHGLGAFRECYEAYVIRMFSGLLKAALEDGRGPMELTRLLTKQVEEEWRHRDLAQHEQAYEHEHTLLTGTSGGTSAVSTVEDHHEHLQPPLSCFFCYDRTDPISVANMWLRQCDIMTIQYVFIKAICAIIPFVVTVIGLDYDIPLVHGYYVNWKALKIWIILLQNIAVAIAIWGLLTFYHGTLKDLAWCKPWPKFLCIKLVVFMTFWQEIFLQILSFLGQLDDKQAAQCQKVLICFEMLLASIAHHYIFPYQEWQGGYKKERQEEEQLRLALQQRDTLALRRFATEIYSMFTPMPRPQNQNQNQIHNKGQIQSTSELVVIPTAESSGHAHIHGDIDGGDDRGCNNAETSFAINVRAEVDESKRNEDSKVNDKGLDKGGNEEEEEEEVELCSPVVVDSQNNNRYFNFEFSKASVSDPSSYQQIPSEDGDNNYDNDEKVDEVLKQERSYPREIISVQESHLHDLHEIQLYGGTNDIESKTDGADDSNANSNNIFIHGVGDIKKS